MKVKELKEYLKLNEPVDGFKVDDDFDLDIDDDFDLDRDDDLDLDREIISSSSGNTLPPFYFTPMKLCFKAINKNEIKDFGTLFNEFLRSLDKNIDPSGSVKIYKPSYISRKEYSKVTSGNVKPSKKFLFHLCIGLRLNMEESEKLLKLAGLGFTNLYKEDLIIKYYIENKDYNFSDIEESYYQNGCKKFSYSDCEDDFEQEEKNRKKNKRKNKKKE